MKQDEYQALALTRPMDGEFGQDCVEGADPSFRWIAQLLPGILYHCEHDPDGLLHYHFFSPRLTEVTGFEPEAFCEDPAMILSRIHPDDLAAYRAKMENLLSTRIERDWGFEYRFRHEQGHYIWLASHATHSYAEDGSVDTWGVLLDITASKTIEQDWRMSELELRESQRQLTTLISNLAGMVYRCGVDKSLTMLFASRGCEKLTGYTPADLQLNLKAAYHDLMHPDDRGQALAEIEAALAEWRSFALSYRIITDEGEQKWVLDQGQGIAAADGSPAALEGFVLDVTEHENARARVLRVEEKAKASLLASSNLFAMMNHEINTPLHGIVKRCQQMLKMDLGPMQIEQVAAINATSRSLSRIVDESVDFSSLEVGALQLSNVPFSWAAPALAVAKRFAPVARAKGLSLEREFLNDPSGVRVIGDPERLEKLLSQLVRNAIRRAEAGSVALRCGCHASSEETLTLNFEVADPGACAGPPELESIFQTILPADEKDDANTKASGLSLLICQKLTLLMGGHLGVRREEGGGACIWLTIRLPRASDG
jgi:PAS domain S-box-containing protein